MKRRAQHIDDLLWFVSCAIQNMAIASGLRGEDLISACVSEAAMMDELRSAYGLDSECPSYDEDVHGWRKFWREFNEVTSAPAEKKRP